MSEFAGTTALVTGAGSGIGEAVARALHREGARIFAAVHTREQAERLVRELPGCAAAPCDVRDAQAVERMVGDATAALGKIELCVNCAGITGPAQTPIPDYDPAAWAEVIATDLTGMFHCLKYQLPALVARRRWRHRQHDFGQWRGRHSRHGRLYRRQAWRGRAHP
jgi:NAD(P)-dependent dehydrogenase (short-subunit alcohol dehydrogenase family)